MNKNTLPLTLLLAATLAATAQTTRVEIYAPGIARVTKTLDDEARAAKHSYSVLLTPAADAPVVTAGQTLRTDCMEVQVSQEGVVTFRDLRGNVLLREMRPGMVTSITEGVDQGKYRTSQTFRLADDEAIFGLGQRKSFKMNQRGEHVTFWNTNTNICIPYFASDRGYGLYWDNAGRTRLDDDGAQGTTWSSEVDAAGIDYYFLYKDGTQDGVIAQIRQLTGQATMMPLWAMGYWQCRERYKSSDELCDALDAYRSREIPLDGIVQDWQYWGCDSNWNAMKFMNPHYINKMNDPHWIKYLPKDEDPNARYPEPRIKTPEEMVEYVHQHHAHLMISIWASFGPWTEQYRKLDRIGALYDFDTWPRQQGVKPYDPFHPKARDIYWAYLKNLYRMGFDAWWTDSTEPDHWEKPGDDEWMTHDGSWHSVKNAFTMQSNRGIYEHQRAEKTNRKRQLQMSRTSTFGIQHYGTFSWSGDVVSSWETMQNQVPSGLNYVMCGIPMWSTDLGGFFGWEFGNDPKTPYAQELMVRWMQWGTFMPLMRNHCSSPMVSEIWHYGEPGEWAYDVQKKFIELRYRLMPYIYSMMGATVQESGLMMRPLVMDFARDTTAICRNDEYMFGRALLVKPVTQPLYSWNGPGRTSHWIYPDVAQAAAPVDVYLPRGTEWWDFWTNERLAGGQHLQALAPIDRLPVYVRAGSILTFGPRVQWTDEKPWDNLEVRVYPGADGDQVLYEDEGDGYGYEQGQFSQIRFHWDDQARTLTIEAREGSYPGMLQQRQFRICLVGGQTPSGDVEAGAEALQSVSYRGEKVKVKM